jgi:hypothetical protein
MNVLVWQPGRPLSFIWEEMKSVMSDMSGGPVGGLWAVNLERPARMVSGRIRDPVERRLVAADARFGPVQQYLLPVRKLVIRIMSIGLAGGPGAMILRLAVITTPGLTSGRVTISLKLQEILTVKL